MSPFRRASGRRSKHRPGLDTAGRQGAAPRRRKHRTEHQSRSAAVPQGRPGRGGGWFRRACAGLETARRAGAGRQDLDAAEQLADLDVTETLTDALALEQAARADRELKAGIRRERSTATVEDCVAVLNGIYGPDGGDDTVVDAPSQRVALAYERATK